MKAEFKRFTFHISMPNMCISYEWISGPKMDNDTDVGFFACMIHKSITLFYSFTFGIRSFVHSITTFSLTVYFSIFRLCECHVWIFSISVFNVFLFISFVAFLSKSYDSNFTNISCMSVTNTCRQHQIRAFHFRFGFAVIRRTKYTDTIHSRKIRRNNVTPSSEPNITMLQHRWNTQQMKNVTNLIWLPIDWLVLNVFWYAKREIQGERERKKASNGNMLLQTQMHAFEACRVKWASQSTLTMTRFLRATTAKRIMDNNKYSMRTACYSLSSFVDCYFILPVFWHYFSYFFIELYRMYGAFTLNILNKPMQTALANVR